MKKLVVAALMVLSTSAAFAGPSESLKAILKAENYAEASRQAVLDMQADIQTALDHALNE